MNIEVRDVTVTLSHKEIVKDVSLKVREKAFVGLLGPNGSGKTTLLKSIYRVLKPVNGVILMNGEDMKTMTYRESARRRNSSRSPGSWRTRSRSRRPEGRSRIRL